MHQFAISREARYLLECIEFYLVVMQKFINDFYKKISIVKSSWAWNVSIFLYIWYQTIEFTKATKSSDD